MAETLPELVDELEVVQMARTRYSQTESYQARLISKYRRLHHYYAPRYGDQWPEDTAQRPGKIHITANICKAAADVDSRLQAIPPRITLPANGNDAESRRRAELAEKTMLRFLDISGWDIWLPDFVKPKCIYGKGILKVFWNSKEKRPDVSIIENPSNLRLGWGSSDFRVLDWAIYEYGISPTEVKRRFPSLDVLPTKDPNRPLLLIKGGDHANPLETIPPVSMRPQDSLSRPVPYQPSDYEKMQLRVWDYWYKGADDIVRNAMLVEGVLAEGPFTHPELIDIPYIVVENEHEPGSPEGISTIEPLIDIQVELNRVLSHWAQLVADEIDPAWQITGDNADSVPDGVVPRAGEIVAAGSGNKIELIPKGVNQFPAQQLMQEFWTEFHRISGLPEILFGQTPGAQTTGRALAVQVEAAANRLDFKRRRLYQGLKELLVFWTFMLEKQNPRITMAMRDDEGNPVEQEVALGDVVRGYRRWKVIAPEITPKDIIENTTNVINKVQAKLISLKTGRDELGIDSPEDEEDLVIEERSNAHLFPGDVQAFTAVMAALQQIQAQQQAMAEQMGGNVQQNAQNGVNAAQQDAQEAQPSLGQDQNEAQPATLAGGPPPGGAFGPGAQSTATTLIRGTPQGGAQALNQISINRRLG